MLTTPMCADQQALQLDQTFHLRLHRLALQILLTLAIGIAVVDRRI